MAWSFLSKPGFVAFREGSGNFDAKEMPDIYQMALIRRWQVFADLFPVHAGGLLVAYMGGICSPDLVIAPCAAVARDLRPEKLIDYAS